MPVVHHVPESLINCAGIASVSRDDVLLAISDVRATEKGEIDRVFSSSGLRFSRKNAIITTKDELIAI